MYASLTAPNRKIWTLIYRECLIVGDLAYMQRDSQSDRQGCVGEISEVENPDW